LAIFFLFPFFISLYYVLRGRPEKAFLNVYLPCTFLVPYYYAFRIPHMPVLSVGTSALIPIGVAMLLKPRIRWQFRRMDALVVIYIVSFGLSEVLREASPKDGMLLWLSEFCEIFLAYIVGRQIIEPNLRLETVKRIIFLFMIQTPFALYEFRFGQNVWLNMAHRVFLVPDVNWFVQLRGGTARIATAFGDAILAGMLFMVAFALNYYLVQIYKMDKSRLGPKMSWLQKYRLPFFILPGLLFLTNSRMPMACGLMCFLFLQIPRFRSIRTGAIVIVLTVGIGAGAVYAYFQHYTSVSEDKAADEAQTSAIYRKQLVEYYQPILDAGGWLGWGTLSHPSVPGLNSIDNNYMLVQLSQGKLGKYTFILIALESVLTLGIFAAKFRSRESQFLLFSLLGALVGVFVSLSTVYLGEQVLQVLFLLIGWAQSLQDTNVAIGARAVASMSEPKFRFKRVIA
jgi:hypothetical protein